MENVTKKPGEVKTIIGDTKKNVIGQRKWKVTKKTGEIKTITGETKKKCVFGHVKQMWDRNLKVLEGRNVAQLVYISHWCTDTQTHRLTEKDKRDSFENDKSCKNLWSVKKKKVYTEKKKKNLGKHEKILKKDFFKLEKLWIKKKVENLSTEEWKWNEESK